MPGGFNIWEGVYASFAEAAGSVKGAGFRGETYATRSLDAARECLAALELGRPIPTFHKQRSTLLPPVVAMMLAHERPLRVLDFGGGLAIAYMTLAESLGHDAEDIRYCIVEVEEVCAVGKQLMGDRVEYLPALPSETSFDLVHTASALQYVEDWRGALESLGAYGARYMLLSDVFAGSNPTFVTLQNYYGSAIRHWFLNLNELVSAISSIGYRISMKSFVSARRLNTDDVLPMSNFPPSHRVEQSLHLLLQRSRA